MWFIICQVARARRVSGLWTVWKGSAAPDTSGHGSVSPCWRRGRCAHVTGGKELTVWRSSSAATAAPAWPAEARERNPEQKAETSTPASRADPAEPLSAPHTHTPCARMQTHMQRRQRKTDSTEGCANKRTDRISWTDAEKLHRRDVSCCTLCYLRLFSLGHHKRQIAFVSLYKELLILLAVNYCIVNT